MTTIYIMLGFCCLCLLILVVKCLYDWKQDLDFQNMVNEKLEQQMEEIEKHKKKN